MATAGEVDGAPGKRGEGAQGNEVHVRQRAGATVQRRDEGGDCNLRGVRAEAAERGGRQGLPDPGGSRFGLVVGVVEGGDCHVRGARTLYK
eukprot:2480679-Pyramimonas_sp.AAC.1